MKKEAINTFEEGLNYDLNPLVTPNNVLTDNVNGTFLTFNGDELSLQNDAGNTKIKLHSAGEWDIDNTYSKGHIAYDLESYKCYRSKENNNKGNILSNTIYWEEITGYVQLSDGFYPIGIKEHGGVLYIVSVKEDNENLIGDFEINQSSNTFGFGLKSIYLEKGRSYIFEARGNSSSDALTEGCHNKIYIYLWGYNDEGNWVRIQQNSLDFKTDAMQTKRVSFTANYSGTYEILSFKVINTKGDPQAIVTSPVVFTQWYKVYEHGSVMEFGSYPSPEEINSDSLNSGMSYESNPNTISELLYNPKVINNVDFKSGTCVQFTSSGTIDLSHVSLQKFQANNLTGTIKKFYKIKLLQQLTTGWIDLTDQIWEKYAKFKGGNINNSGTVDHWLNDSNFKFYCQSRFKGKLQLTIEIEDFVFELQNSLELTINDGRYLLNGTIYTGENPETSLNVKSLEIRYNSGNSSSLFTSNTIFGENSLSFPIDLQSRELLTYQIIPRIYYYNPINLFKYSDNFWRDSGWQIPIVAWSEDPGTAQVTPIIESAYRERFLTVQCSSTTHRGWATIPLPEDLPNGNYTFSVDTLESTKVTIQVPTASNSEYTTHDLGTSNGEWVRRTISFGIGATSRRNIAIFAATTVAVSGIPYSTAYKNFKLSSGTHSSLEWIKDPSELWEDLPSEYINNWIYNGVINISELELPIPADGDLKLKLSGFEEVDIYAGEEVISVKKLYRKLILVDNNGYNLNNLLLFSPDEYYFQAFEVENDYNNYNFDNPKVLGVFLVSQSGSNYIVNGQKIKFNSNITLLKSTIIKNLLSSLSSIGSIIPVEGLINITVYPKNWGVWETLNVLNDYDLGSRWNELYIWQNGQRIDGSPEEDRKMLFRISAGTPFEIRYPYTPTYVSTGESSDKDINFGIIETVFREITSKSGVYTITFSCTLPSFGDFPLFFSPRTAGRIWLLMDHKGNDIYSGSLKTTDSYIPLNHYVINSSTQEVLTEYDWNESYYWDKNGNIVNIDNKGDNAIFESNFKYVADSNRFYRYEIINI